MLRIGIARLEFSNWPEAIVLKPPCDHFVLPGVLVLCNSAQLTENWMSRSDSYVVLPFISPDTGWRCLSMGEQTPDNHNWYEQMLHIVS